MMQLADADIYVCLFVFFGLYRTAQAEAAMSWNEIQDLVQLFQLVRVFSLPSCSWIVHVVPSTTKTYYIYIYIYIYIY